MTRIIAGSARGRPLTVPPTGTRPTSDRVREAVFSMIAARLDLSGAAVLDLYAGSGALALEALSRGAGHATLVDRDGKAAAIIGRNASICGFADVTVARRPVSSFLGGAGRPFDLVFLDPPYALAESALGADLTSLVAGGWLADDAVIVVERSARSPETELPAALTREVGRVYGDTRVELVRHLRPDPASDAVG